MLAESTPARLNLGKGRSIWRKGSWRSRKTAFLLLSKRKVTDVVSNCPAPKWFWCRLDTLGQVPIWPSGISEDQVTPQLVVSVFCFLRQWTVWYSRKAKNVVVRTEFESWLSHHTTLVKPLKLSKSHCFYLWNSSSLIKVKGWWGLNETTYAKALEESPVHRRCALCVGLWSEQVLLKIPTVSRNEPLAVYKLSCYSAPCSTQHSILNTELFSSINKMCLNESCVLPVSAWVCDEAGLRAL